MASNPEDNDRHSCLCETQIVQNDLVLVFAFAAVKALNLTFENTYFE